MLAVFGDRGLHKNCSLFVHPVHTGLKCNFGKHQAIDLFSVMRHLQRPKALDVPKPYGGKCPKASRGCQNGAFLDGSNTALVIGI